MGAVWSALLVGGGLAGALFFWLLRGSQGDPEKDGDAQHRQDAPPGEVAAPGGESGGGGGLSPRPSKPELITKPEHLLESNGHLISETKGLSNLPETQRLQNSGADLDNMKEHAPAGQLSDTHSGACSEVLRNKSFESHVGEWRLPKGQESPAKAATSMTEKVPCSNVLVDRTKGARPAQLDSQVSVDHEDWEVVSRHSSWGEVGLSGSLEASGLSLNQGMDYARSTLTKARGCETDEKAVSPKPPQVSISFQVHYTVSTDEQFIAVTGDHESLGRWKAYIPLHCCQDGLWSHSVLLPANTVVEWKFVLVENGEVSRWEECSNRCLQTGHEDRVVHGWWGFTD